MLHDLLLQNTSLIATHKKISQDDNDSSCYMSSKVETSADPKNMYWEEVLLNLVNQNLMFFPSFRFFY